MEIILVVALGLVIQLIVLMVGFKQVKQYKQETVRMFEHLQEQLVNSLNPIQEVLEKNITNINHNITTLKNHIDDNFHTSMQQIASLKLVNYIDVANEIYKSKEYTYENEYFIQEVGHCKIIKMADKKSGDITHVYYDKNENKSHTETFSSEILKYSMIYDNKKLVKGFEYNYDGDIIFEYEYNEAGEITKKTEYCYEQNRVLEKTQETIY